MLYSNNGGIMRGMEKTFTAPTSLYADTQTRKETDIHGYCHGNPRWSNMMSRMRPGESFGSSLVSIC